MILFLIILAAVVLLTFFIVWGIDRRPLIALVFAGVVGILGLVALRLFGLV